MTVEQFDDLCEKLKLVGESAEWEDPFGKWRTEYVAEQDNRRISLRYNGFSNWLCYYVDGSAANVFSKVGNEVVSSGRAGSYRQFCKILKEYKNRATQETDAWLNMLEEK